MRNMGTVRQGATKNDLRRTVLYNDWLLETSRYFPFRFLHGGMDGWVAVIEVVTAKLAVFFKGEVYSVVWGGQRVARFGS